MFSTKTVALSLAGLMLSVSVASAQMAEDKAMDHGAKASNTMGESPDVDDPCSA